MFQNQAGKKAKSIEIEPAKNSAENDELSIPSIPKAKKSSSTAKEKTRTLTRSVDTQTFGRELMQATAQEPSQKISLEQAKAIMKFLHTKGYLNIRKTIGPK